MGVYSKIHTGWSVAKNPGILITDLYCLWTSLDCAGIVPGVQNGLSWSPRWGRFLCGRSPASRFKERPHIGPVLLIG